MKIRDGFVSNSSSSSFIISNKENFDKVIELLKNNCKDYYILDDILYTSCINDGLGIYREISDLSDDSICTSWNEPYDTQDFYEFEGELGVSSVWIEKKKCKDKQAVEQMLKDKLYNYVKQYILMYEITAQDTIFDDKEVFKDAPYFLNECCEIVGYMEE